MPEGTNLVSRIPLGSGIYEIDLQGDFDIGGFFFKTDAQHQGGLDALLMFAFFEPIDGNAGLWDHKPTGFNEFPILWSLGKRLEKGRVYRLRIETYGDRHAFTVLDPESRRALAGPLTYRVDTAAGEGYCGIRVKHGSALVRRFAFAPAKPTTALRPAPPAADSLVHAAFVSRATTRRLGQWAPAGTPMPVGWSTATRFDFARQHPELYGPGR